VMAVMGGWTEPIDRLPQACLFFTRISRNKP
jgi:hypothetical protein